MHLLRRDCPIQYSLPAFIDIMAIIQEKWTDGSLVVILANKITLRQLEIRKQ